MSAIILYPFVFGCNAFTYFFSFPCVFIFPTNSSCQISSPSFLISSKSVESGLKNDLENDGASTDLDLNPDDENGFGGPNRTNAANIPSGQYINVTAGGKGYVGGKPGSEINTVTLHQYTPDRTYLNTINDPDNFPEPSVQLPNNDITSNIPTDIDSGIAGDVEGGTPDVSRYTFPA